MGKAENALIIFIKNPELGKVKTRLAKTTGPQRALKIYLQLLAHTRDIAMAVKHIDRKLYYSNYIAPDDNWPASHFEKCLQTKGNLGLKMAAAFQETLQEYSKAVIIGSDCASLTPQILSDAFHTLEHHDFVIGPATDGGYYLLGMKQFTPALFENIAWSTETVLSTTIQRIEALRQSFRLLPELSDIDHEEDWIKYGWDIDYQE